MIDSADRCYNGLEVTGKTGDILQEAMDTCWCQIFGPVKFLIIDGDKSIMASDTKDFLVRKGISVRTRAPGQHARMIERRGAITRHAMHCIEEQLASESITVSFKTLLPEAIFAGNSLANYGGASPYQARMGHQPSMLPGMTAPPNRSD